MKNAQTLETIHENSSNIFGLTQTKVSKKKSIFGTNSKIQKGESSMNYFTGRVNQLQEQKQRAGALSPLNLSRVSFQSPRNKYEQPALGLFQAQRSSGQADITHLISEAVYSDDHSQENTLEELLEESKEESQQNSRVGDHAFEKFYKEYKKTPRNIEPDIEGYEQKNKRKFKKTVKTMQRVMSERNNLQTKQTKRTQSKASRLRFNIEEFDFNKEESILQEDSDEFDIYSENPYGTIEQKKSKFEKKVKIQPKKPERLEPIFSSHQGSRTSRNPTSLNKYRSHTPGGVFTRSRISSDTPQQSIVEYKKEKLEWIKKEETRVDLIKLRQKVTTKSSTMHGIKMMSQQGRRGAISTMSDRTSELSSPTIAVKQQNMSPERKQTTVRGYKSKNHLASTEYLKELEKQKMPPLPFGVLLKRIRNFGKNTSGITKLPSQEVAYEHEKKVDLTAYSIGPGYGTALGKGLKHLQLDSVKLSGNRINDDNLQSISQAFDSAKEIDLSYNDLGYQGLKTFLKMTYLDCEDPSRIEILNLEGNLLGDKTISAVFRALADSIYIKELNVAKNNISEKSLPSLDYLLQQTTVLKKINLHWNQIKGPEACRTLAQALIINKTVTVIDLSWNNLGSQLSKKLVEDKNLTQTTLDKEILDQRIKQAILDQLGLKSVEELSKEQLLLYTQASLLDIQAGRFLGEWLQKPNALHVDLSFNHLTYLDCEVIGEFIRHNHTLLGLHLRGNDGRVDSMGFAYGQKQQKATQQTQLTFKRMPQMNKPSSQKPTLQNKGQDITATNQTIPKLQPMNQDQRIIEIDKCWICEGWQEYHFGIKLDSTMLNESMIYNQDGTAKEAEVFLHLQFENYEKFQIKNAVLEDGTKTQTYSVWRMIPPGKSLFFFSVNGRIVIPEDQGKKEKLQVSKLKDVQGLSLAEQGKEFYTPFCYGEKMQPYEVLDEENSDTKLIHCKPRKLPGIEIMKEEEEEQEKPLWGIEKSIFRSFKIDTEDLLRKCFEFDWSQMRKPKWGTDTNEEAIKEALFQSYKNIKQIYRVLAALGNINGVFAIGLNVYTQFIREAFGEETEDYNQSAQDMIFIMVNASRKGTLIPPIGLVRFQFLEILLRCSIAKYFNIPNYINTQINSREDAVNHFMSQHIKKFTDQFDPWPFRDTHYWNERVENILLAFEPLLIEVYRTYGGHKKKPGESHFMTFDEFENLILNGKIIEDNDLIAQRDIVVCFAQAMMTQVNEIDSPRHMRANYIEFLEALARVAFKASLAPYRSQKHEFSQNLSGNQQLKPQHNDSTLILPKLSNRMDTAIMSQKSNQSKRKNLSPPKQEILSQQNMSPKSPRSPLLSPQDSQNNSLNISDRFNSLNQFKETYLATNEQMSPEVRQAQPLFEKLISVLHKIHDYATRRDFRERYVFPNEEIGTGYFELPFVSKKQQNRQKTLLK